MSDRITWDELKARWDSADHEIIDRIKQGLRPYSEYTGNLFDCPPGHHFGHHAKMRISELNNQIEKRTDELINSGTDPYLTHSDNEICKLQNERSIHHKQLDKYINEDPYCRSWKHFTFGRDEEKAKELISKFKDLMIFKLKDIEDFEKEHGYVRKSADSRITPKSEQLEDFIKRLEFFYENDSEIKIKEPGKRAKSFGFDSLGFKNNQTKQWKSLIELLNDPNHEFALGRAGKKNSSESKTYYARRNILSSLNKKLIEFLRKEYSLQIPEGYKLYEKCPEKGSGIYKFKFNILKESYSPKRLEAQFEALTHLELTEEVENLCKKFKKTQDEKYEAKFVAATKVALRKGFLSEAQVKEKLEPIKPPEEYRYKGH